MKIFVWDLGFDCNYKCDYCFFTQTGWESIKKQHGEMKGIEEICQAWESIYGKYGTTKVYITGGEPFLHERFSEIISNLSRLHLVHITTNLSLPLEKFIAINNPLKVEINATFHPFKVSPEIFA